MSTSFYEKILEYTVSSTRVQVVKIGKNYKYSVTDQPKALGREDIVRAIESINERNITLFNLIKAVRRTTGKKPKFSELVCISRTMRYKKLQILLDDPYIEDISIVGPGTVWVRHSEVLRRDPGADYIPTNITIKTQAEFLEYMELLAEKIGKLVTPLNPIADGNLPEEDGGHRVHLVHPEVAGGEGEIVIRKKRGISSISLDEMIKRNTISPEVVELIKKIIDRRGSIIIAGPPGSGKTTLLRAILYSLIPKEWKIVIIEDTPEIDPLPESAWVRYIVPASLWGSGRDVDQMALAKAALRASVNRYIVIGETRGREARVLPQAINMGLGSLTTFHGGSAREVVTRLMSPPIELSPYQVAMFDAIIVMGFSTRDGKLQRTVVSVEKPVYDDSSNRVIIRKLYKIGTRRMIDYAETKR